LSPAGKFGGMLHRCGLVNRLRGNRSWPRRRTGRISTARPARPTRRRRRCQLASQRRRDLGLRVRRVAAYRNSDASAVPPWLPHASVVIVEAHPLLRVDVLREQAERTHRIVAVGVDPSLLSRRDGRVRQAKRAAGLVRKIAAPPGDCRSANSGTGRQPAATPLLRPTVPAIPMMAY